MLGRAHATSESGRLGRHIRVKPTRAPRPSQADSDGRGRGPARVLTSESVVETRTPSPASLRRRGGKGGSSARRRGGREARARAHERTHRHARTCPHAHAHMRAGARKHTQARARTHARTDAHRRGHRGGDTGKPRPLRGTQRERERRDSEREREKRLRERENRSSPHGQLRFAIRTTVRTGELRCALHPTALEQALLAEFCAAVRRAVLGVAQARGNCKHFHSFSGPYENSKIDYLVNFFYFDR